MVGELQPAGDLAALLGHPAFERRQQIVGERALDRQQRPRAHHDDEGDEREQQAVAERATQAAPA
jgi:hypothetical protein